MSTHDTRIPRVTAVLGVEEPQHLLCQSHQKLSNARQISHVGTNAHKRALLPTADKPNGNASFRIIPDQTVSEEQSVNTKTDPVAPLTSKQLFVRDAVAGVPVHVKEAMKKMVLETLNKSKTRVYNRLSVDLEDLVLRTMQKVVDSLEFISLFSDAVIDNSSPRWRHLSSRNNGSL